MPLPAPAKALLRYLRRVAKAGDSFASVLTGGALWSTISGRLGAAQRNGSPTACLFCRILSLFERDHCELARLDDEKRQGL